MISGKTAYHIYAVDSPWSAWVRPVPFVSGTTSILPLDKPPHIDYINSAQKNIAIVVDLPDDDAILEGLSLAQLGYRPIPLYNGTDAPADCESIVRNDEIKSSLVLSAEILQSIPLAADAPPAFLLDANRTHRHKSKVSTFDNSWDIYEQDMPTANFLKQNGIDTILVRGKKLQRDLKPILYKYQLAGIKTILAPHFAPPTPKTIRKPLRQKK